MKSIPKILAVLAFCAAAGTASAQLMVYSNFEASTGYTAGSTIIGVTPTGAGATGINGTWTVASGTAAFTAQTGTMSYVGGSVSVHGGSQHARMTGTSSMAYLQLSSVSPDTTGYFFSFLMRGTGITLTEQAYIQWGNSTTSSAERIDAGMGGNGTASFVYSRDTNGASGGTGVSSETNGSPIPFALTSGQTYFVVGKLISDGSNFSQYYLWVNPTSATVEGSGAAWASSDIFNTNTYNGNIGYLSLRNFNLAGADTFDVDEVRLGTSWSDVVVAIPEPTTWALLAAAGTFMMVIRRRRQD